MRPLGRILSAKEETGIAMYTMPCPTCLHGYYVYHHIAYRVLLPAAVAANLAAALTSLMVAVLFANGYRASRDEKMGLTAAGFLVLSAAAAVTVVAPRTLLPPLLYPLGYALIAAARLTPPAAPALILLVERQPRILLDAAAAGLAVAAFAPSPSTLVRLGCALLATSHLLDVAVPAVKLLAVLLRGAALLLVSGSIVARSMPKLPTEEAEEA